MQSKTLRAAAALLVTVLAPAASPASAGDLVIDGSFVSTVPTGTAPIEVASTTRVTDLNADLLDGIDGSELARALGNVVRVGATGGDFTSIQAALDSITTASAANPFLVRVGPGVYFERVALKPFVDVEGSGEGVTVIRQAGSVPPDLGTVAGADDAELRFVTVVNDGGAGNLIGVYNEGVSPRLLHVTVEVATSLSANAYGIWNEGATGVPTTPELSHVTVSVFGTGDINLVMGVLNGTEANTRASDLRVHVGGDTSSVKYGVFNSDAAPVLRDVEVTTTSDEGSASVFGVVNQDVDAAVLRSMRVETTGGGTRYGVSNARSALEIRDLEVEVSGTGGTSYGVFDEESTVVLESCSIEAAGGANTVGVFKADASGAVRDCTVAAVDGTGVETGLQGFDSTSSGSFSLDVEQARLRGADAAVSAPSTYTVRIGASGLDGGVLGGATYTCASAYDGSFAPLGTGCT